MARLIHVSIEAGHMDELQKFYKSKQWEKFRKIIIEERADADGFIKCAICGDPILKKYDLIVHHKKELTAETVNDATIALNPNNIECVHFRCHNKIHNRFGYNSTSAGRNIRKRVFIVYGSACAGKSTFVHNNATENDLIVDLDNIWQMISINQRYDKPAPLKSAVFEIRDKLFDIIKYRSGKWHDAYIITGGALQGERERLSQRVGADRLIFIDTPFDECLKRCESRGDHAEEWRGYVREWFETFQPEPEDETDRPPSENRNG